MISGFWNWAKVAAAGALFGAAAEFGRRLKWPIAIAVLVILAVIYPHVSGALILAGAVLSSTGSWWAAGGTLVLLWALWQALKDAIACGRGEARTASEILRGLARVHKLRKAFPAMAARTGVLAARGNGGTELAPAGRWRPMKRGSVQGFVAYGTVGREWPDLVTACKRLPQQIGAARARPIQIPGVTTGADVLFEWGAHLARLWTAAEVYALARQLGCPAGQIPLAVTEDGLLGTVPANKSILLGGMTESGKSSTIWMFLLGCLLQGHRVRLWVIDPKGGVELGYLEKHLGKKGQLEVHRYVSDDQAVRTPAAYGPGGFWSELTRTMNGKEAEARKRGTRSLDLAAGDVLDILIVDEWLSIANDPEFRTQRMDHIANRVAFRGRASLCIAMIATQSGNKDVVGPIRDLIATKLAFKTPNSSNTDTILGEGASRDGASAHTLDLAHDKGVCEMSTEGAEGYTRMRVGYVSDREARAIAAGTIPDFETVYVDPTRPCAVYSATFNVPVTIDALTYQAGTLAYVGRAYDPPARWRQHAADPAEWWWQHCTPEVMRWYDTPALGMSPFDQAAMAEEDAIKRLRPLFNDLHNRDNPGRISWRRKAGTP